MMAVFADSRTKPDHRGRTQAKMVLHELECFFENLLLGASSAGMDRCNYALRVKDEDGQAVGVLDGQSEPWSCRETGISSKDRAESRFCNDAAERAVGLLERDELGVTQCRVCFE